MSEIIRVENLLKTFPASPVPGINHLSFAIPSGNVFCLMGENGAGKSTLLRLLAGLLDADAGAIYFMGKLLEGPSQKLIPGHPRIKLLRQDAQLRPNVSVYDNLRYELKSHPLAYLKKRVDALFGLCKLEGLENRLPQELSGGQRQRAALALAIADEPELVLLDEPFSSADVMQKLHLKKEIFDIFRHSGTTLVFSTHDAEEALALADAIAVMRKGDIIQMGTPEEIYRHPSSRYVAELAGACNLIPPELMERQEHPKKSTLCFARAEHIRLCRKGSADFTGKLTDVMYQGYRYALKVRVYDQYDLLLYANRRLEVGKEVHLCVDKDKLHYTGA